MNVQILSTSSPAVTAYATRPAATPSAAAASPAGDPAGEAGAGVETVDFSHMTRQQLFDWMNAQIKSGRMTLDQSTSFLGMTMKVSASTGQPVDMRTDTTIYDFADRARQGLEGARWRHDDREAGLLEQAIAIMRRNQGAVAKVDLKV